MPTERLTALLSKDALWDIMKAGWAVEQRRSWPHNVDAPYGYVLGASSWAWELDQEAWIEGVKQRLGIITLDDDGEARVSRLELAREDPPWPELSRSPWGPLSVVLVK